MRGYSKHCAFAVSALLLALAPFALASCAPAPDSSATGEREREATSTADVTGTPLPPVESDLATLPASTVPAPDRPTFRKGWFEVGEDGRGKAVAAYHPDTITSPQNQATGHTTRRFVVSETVIDGVWVYGMEFWGRVTDETVFVSKEQVAFGSDKFWTVSRTFADMKNEAAWHGPRPGSSVSVTFLRQGDGPVRMLTIQQLDPVFRTARLVDPQIAYTGADDSDPIVRAALVRTGAVEGSIAGYVIRFSSATLGGFSGLELVASRDGQPYRRMGGAGLGWGHFANPPITRLQPESAVESAARERATRRIAEMVGEEIPGLASALPDTYAYIVRVSWEPGSTRDVIVGADGSINELDQDLTIQPWPDPVG